MSKSQPHAFEELKSHLRDMFQLDRGDLDFGIYRVMNIKRDEVEEFLENRLLPQVREILGEYSSSNRSDLQEELERIIKNLQDAGAEVDTAERVIDLRAELAKTLDLNKIATEIYSDLYNFFKRYYSEGDFMSLRRYKEGVYALPYEGEEVKLHWANHDQYYIKTGENLKHYTFKVADGKRVRFEITAANTETNNNKAAKGKERRFLLAEEDKISVDGDQLTIRFEFRPDDANRKQDDINKATRDSLLTKAECVAFGLNKPAPTDANPERTLLEKHLTTYTAKFAFDYFIHKDLGGFLRRELDFFIKNEIMHLDDIENETAPKAENYLAKIKAMRGVGHKIIDFLAQLEEFQKKLWLKKKFVLETHYCITLNRITGSEAKDELLRKIAANDEQREEWVQLFAIDEVEGYTTPLTVDFLKANDKLQVDTRFFDADFKYTLLSLFENLDEVTNGVLIDSENFQALNLLQDRYCEQIKCIYIDPPYNTGNDGFLYKDSYQHSGWLSMMENRLIEARQNLSDDGVIFISIDDNEQVNLKKLCDEIFGEKNFITIFCWEKKKKPSFLNKNLGSKFEYIITYAKARENTTSFSIDLTEEGKKYPLNNAGNQKSILTFPAGSVLFNISDQTVEPQDMSEGNIYTKLMTPLDIQDGKNANQFTLEGEWRYSQKKLDEIIENNENIIISKIPFRPNHVKQGGAIKKMHNLLSIKHYNIQTNEDADAEQENLFGANYFDYTKPTGLIEVLTKALMHNDDSGIILDFFSGSGTTAHAVINLNREDDSNRKYILVEMGEHFSTVTKPRVQKAAYSLKWKDGKPDERDGVSQVIKYLSLEQYEDTLDNLHMKLAKGQASFLYDNPQAREEFMLGYMMDVESAGSPSLLNIDNFANPFDYQLKISRDDETKDMAIDLIETFNYLLGLKVEKIRRFDNGIITVEGKTLNEEDVLVIWRDTKAIDSDALDTWFTKAYLSEPLKAKAIYVNGDNHLENLKPKDQQWDVRLTEAEFKRRMFDVGDV